MIRAELNQVIMKNGMSLIIKGASYRSPQNFEINVGESMENIALYCNVSFMDSRIFLNSKKDGHFGKQMEIQDFPFQAEKDFKMTFTLQGDTFEVQLPDDFVVKFVSPLSEIQCKRIWVDGDVTIKGISLM